MPDEPHLDEYVQAIAKLAAKEAAQAAVDSIGKRVNGLDTRVRALEISRAWILGAILGSGAVSGTVVSIITRVL